MLCISGVVRSVRSLRFVFACLIVTHASSAAARRSLHEFAWPWSRPVVQTRLGPLKGVKQSDGVHAWLGVPYAQPPVGELRFQPPAPIQESWKDDKDCGKVQRVCPQFHLTKGLKLGNEDCLYLNVWVPSQATVKKPAGVLLWIFGGAFEIGDGYEFGWYDGHNLAQATGKVVVSFNYRVGVFGFMAHEALASENSQGTTGNYGLQDQRLAMQWVHDNIALFGGDPLLVTIFGESAGAMSVCYHLSNKMSGGLFSRAIMESGNCDGPEMFQPLRSALAVGNAVSTAMGCNKTPEGTVACLRALSTDEMMSQTWYPGHSSPNASDVVPVLAPVFTFFPVVDGSPIGLLSTPYDAFLAGTFNRVPVIMGTNHDEGTIFLPFLPFLYQEHIVVPLSENGLAKALQHIFRNESTVKTSMNHYPASQFKTEDSRTAAMLRDYVFVCAERRAMRAILALNHTDVWEYRFTYPSHWIDTNTLGDYHTSELFFLFRTHWPSVLVHPWSPKDVEVMNDIDGYWNNLAGTGNPNGASLDKKNTELPFWPRFTSMEGVYMELTVPPVVKAGLDNDHCDMWDSLRPYDRNQ